MPLFVQRIVNEDLHFCFYSGKRYKYVSRDDAAGRNRRQNAVRWKAAVCVQQGPQPVHFLSFSLLFYFSLTDFPIVFSSSIDE